MLWPNSQAIGKIDRKSYAMNVEAQVPGHNETIKQGIAFTSGIMERPQKCSVIKEEYFSQVVKYTGSVTCDSISRTITVRYINISKADLIFVVPTSKSSMS